MNQPERTLWSRLRWPVAVVLLLAAMGSAGYFLGLPKLLADKLGNPQPTPQTAGNRSPKPANVPVAAAIQPPAAPKSDSNAGASPAENKPSQAPAAATPPGDLDPAQSRFSLQAASFPSEAGAKEFSEKLVRAGVPAYILSVQIPKRGKWFRVRVGRFATADDAAKYAAQARQRARASGIGLDLIVCGYEKP
jgi:cell division septation protein DedD